MITVLVNFKQEIRFRIKFNLIVKFLRKFLFNNKSTLHKLNTIFMFEFSNPYIATIFCRPLHFQTMNSD